MYIMLLYFMFHDVLEVVNKLWELLGYKSLNNDRFWYIHEVLVILYSLADNINNYFILGKK